MRFSQRPSARTDVDDGEAVHSSGTVSTAPASAYDE